MLNEKKGTDIILQRHGESLANEKRIYLGHLDWGLSSLGIRQAQITAEFLKNEQIDAIYSSDLARAYQTALAHAQLRGMEVKVREGLREVFLGKWEGVLIDELSTRWYDEFVLGWQKNFGLCTPPGGESIAAVRERMYDTVVEIARENLGGTVLIAGHAAAIRALWGRIANIPPEKMGTDTVFPRNASLTRIRFDGERLLPVEFSNDSHLCGAVKQSF